MPGMMNDELKAKMGVAEAAPAPEEDTVPDEAGGEPASPEEQQAFNEFVNEGLKLIYEGGKVRPQILEYLDDDPSDLIKVLGEEEALKQFSPVVALAATAVVVVLQLVRRAGDQKPADEIIFHGGKLLLEDLSDLADEADIHDFTPEEVHKAWYIGLDLYRETASAEGLLDKTQLADEFEQIKAADAQGMFGGGQPAQAEQPGQPEGGG